MEQQLPLTILYADLEDEGLLKQSLFITRKEYEELREKGEFEVQNIKRHYRHTIKPTHYVVLTAVHWTDNLDHIYDQEAAT